MQVGKQRGSINKLGFLLGVIGSAVGLGGIWGFPTLMYAHRGAFLIPFLICMVLCSIPVLFIEMTIGNKSQMNHIEFFTRNAGKKGAFFAWLQSSTVILLSTYYSVLIAWTLINIGISFTNYLNVDNYFYQNILNVTNDNPSSFQQLGGINWKVLLCVLLVWVLLFVILSGGVDKGIDKANKFFIPSLFLMIIALTIYTSTFQGAATGLNQLFTFDAKNLLDPTIWKDAFGQAFFMLSTCTGTIYIYAAHAPKKQDNTNHAFVVGIGTSIVGLLTAIIIFNAIGALAYQKQLPFEKVFNQGGSTLIFQVLPELFRYINQSTALLGNFIAVIFFLTLFFAGISSLIGQVESMVNGLEYEIGMKRIKALLFSCLIAMLIAVLFTFDNAGALFQALGTWVAQIWLLLLGFVLLVGINPYFWNLYQSLQTYNNAVSWIKWRKIYSFLLLVLAPIALLICLGAACYEFGQNLIANSFTNGLYGLTLGFVVPLTMTTLLVFHQSIRKIGKTLKPKKGQ